MLGGFLLAGGAIVASLSLAVRAVCAPGAAHTLPCRLTTTDASFPLLSATSPPATPPRPCAATGAQYSRLLALRSRTTVALRKNAPKLNIKASVSPRVSGGTDRHSARITVWTRAEVAASISAQVLPRPRPAHAARHGGCARRELVQPQGVLPRLSGQRRRGRERPEAAGGHWREGRG